MAKHEGLGAAIAVLLAISGLIVLVGVILLMMWMQPGIQHSPATHSGAERSPATMQSRTS